MTIAATVAPAELERWVRALLQAAGLESAASGIVAEMLVDASLRGVASHGVARLPTYLERLRAGGMTRDPRPRVVREDGAVALVDGDHGPGQVAGAFATEHAIALARRHGVGAVSVRASGHFGAASF